MTEATQEILINDTFHNFTIIPNIADDELGPYEGRLFWHYVRVGYTYESTRTTAEKTKMSVGKVVETRRTLQELDYIEITEPKFQNDTVKITIKMAELWARNHNKYPKQRSPDEHRVHDVNAGCSPHEPKNNPIEEIKDLSSPDGDDDEDFYGLAGKDKRKQTELELMICAVTGAKELSDTMVGNITLVEIVGFDMAEGKSRTLGFPATLYEGDVNYKTWVDECVIPILKSKPGRISRSKLISAVRNFNWFIEWQRKRQVLTDIDTTEQAADGSQYNWS